MVSGMPRLSGIKTASPYSCSSTARVQSIHIDIVGPLPVNQGHTYLLTVIDRFTRWPETIPLPNSQAATCPMTLLQHWVACFSVPEGITSNRGRVLQAVGYPISSYHCLSYSSKQYGGTTSLPVEDITQGPHDFTKLVY